MKSNGSSERHQNNNLNVMIEFAKYLDCDTTFYNINKKQMIISFLDTKIKNSDNDPNIRWIMLKKKIIALQRMLIIKDVVSSYLLNNFNKIKVQGSIVKLNGLITWLFNDVVVSKEPSGLTSILYNKMAFPFASPSATALYCFPVPLRS